MQSYRTKSYDTARFQDPFTINTSSALCSAATADIGTWIQPSSATVLEFGLKYIASTSAVSTTGRFVLQLITSAGTITTKASIITVTSATIGKAAQTATLTGFNVRPNDKLRVRRNRQGKGGNTKIGKVILYIQRRDTPPTA